MGSVRASLGLSLPLPCKTTAAAAENKRRTASDVRGVNCCPSVHAVPCDRGVRALKGATVGERAGVAGGSDTESRRGYWKDGGEMWIVSWQAFYCGEGQAMEVSEPRGRGEWASR